MPIRDRFSSLFSTRGRRFASNVTFALACVFVACGPASLALADDADPEISSVAIGFDGRAKVGRWTPVSFQLSGAPGAVVSPAVTAPDPDGSPTTWELPECKLDDSGSARVSGVFKIGRLEARIQVTAGTASVTVAAGAQPAVDPVAPVSDDEEEEGKAASVETEPADATAEADTNPRDCLLRPQDVPFIAVLGSAPGFQTAYLDPKASGAATARSAVEIIELSDAAEFPASQLAFDSLDVVVLSQRFDLNSDQSTALADWVRRGGHVVIALDRDAESFTASELQAWAPFTVLREDEFFELASLVGRIPGTPAVNVADGIHGLIIESAEGQVLASALNGPLAIRAPYGLGRVTVLAVDWSDSTITKWSGLAGLCRYLADIDLPSRESSSRTTTQLRPTGVSELATQLAAQLDHFGAVARPSYWTIIALAFAFLLLVGLLDYLLVHRVLRRPQLTWFTFPAWIMFAAAAATLGADHLNSSERQANQFDLVDIDCTSGLERVQSWKTVYSPESVRLRMETEAADWLIDSADPTMRSVWSGIPESSFGGMNRAGGLSLATNPPYSIEPNASAIANVPIGQWSSKAFAATWSSDAPAAAKRLVSSDLADNGTGYLEGTVTHHLPDAITEWCLAYGNIAVFPKESARADVIPSIPPGVPWRVDDRTNRRRLKTYLQGTSHQYIGDSEDASGQRTITTTTYDPLGLDPFPLARMLTYYRVADGLGYTGLTNTSFERSDLSRVIPLKRAVLFGRIASPAVKYIVDGDSVQPQERWTFVRIVLPVTPGEAPDPRDFNFPETR